jgi:hypothetical protein
MRHAPHFAPTSRALVKAMRALSAALEPEGGIVSWRINPDDSDVFVTARTFDHMDEIAAEAAARLPLLETYEIVRFD